MELTALDIATFVGFLVVVVAVSLYASRRENTQEDYFLAGRKLTWPLIGFSLIASNISTEHFVGMAGQAFGQIGLAVAAWEWSAAIALVIVAWWFLPKFLRIGIYTMPEFLEYRYDRPTRTIMATYLMVLYVVALLATVLYSSAQGLNAIFGVPQMAGIWVVGAVAATYTIYGGLKAVVWSDLIQGGALLLGGALVLYLGLKLTGGGTLAEDGGVIGGSIIEGWRTFREANAAKLHTVLPSNHPDLPWTAVFFGGMWIPVLFYWGLNQFITQRALGARSLKEAQKGIYLACVFKLIIPFLIVIPGIMAFQLFGEELLSKTGDINKAGEQAYPHMIAQIMPPFLRGVMLAALVGAVMSTFNSGINSASTIFTIDIYRQYVNKGASPSQQVRVGRWATAIIAILACLIAPLPGKFEGVFNYIQEIWGFISPPILAAFVFGMLIERAPAAAGKTALILGPILYGLIRVPIWILESSGSTPAGFLAWPFLHHMMVVFVVLILAMAAITWKWPRSHPIEYPSSKIDTTMTPGSYVIGSLIIVATLALYVVFW